MNRTLPTRLSALLLAVLFLLSTAGEGLGLDACPHHGATPQEQHAHHGAAHHGHGAADHDTSAPAAPQDHPGGCTCIGACQAGTGATLPTAPSVALRATLVEGAVDVPPAASVFVRQHPPYFLPYSLAPPAHG